MPPPLPNLVRCSRRQLLVLSAAVALVACSREKLDDRPERVVEELIERLQRVHGNPKTARGAYELLWSDAKNNLSERAKRASALSGRKVAPEEMISPSHFTLRFRPENYSAAIQGDWAVVTITGEDPAVQRHVVKCVLEDGSWRVVLELPPLPPIHQRPDGG